MTGRFDKYGELKRRKRLRKAKQNGEKDKKCKELNDSDFNMRRTFYDESKQWKKKS